MFWTRRWVGTPPPRCQPHVESFIADDAAELWAFLVVTEVTNMAGAASKVGPGLRELCLDSSGPVRLCGFSRVQH